MVYLPQQRQLLSHPYFALLMKHMNNSMHIVNIFCFIVCVLSVFSAEICFTNQSQCLVAVS